MLPPAFDASLPINRSLDDLVSDMGKVGVVLFKHNLHAKCAFTHSGRDPFI